MRKRHPETEPATKEDRRRREMLVGQIQDIIEANPDLSRAQVYVAWRDSMQRNEGKEFTPDGLMEQMLKDVFAVLYDIARKRAAEA